MARICKQCLIAENSSLPNKDNHCWKDVKSCRCKQCGIPRAMYCVDKSCWYLADDESGYCTYHMIRFVETLNPALKVWIREYVNELIDNALFDKDHPDY